MKKITYTLTHKGWFGFCPVYYANPYRDPEPFVIERHRALFPVFWLSEIMLELIMFSMGDNNPGWPLRITGKIEPRTFEIEVGD